MEKERGPNICRIIDKERRQERTEKLFQYRSPFCFNKHRGKIRIEAI